MLSKIFIQFSDHDDYNDDDDVIFHFLFVAEWIMKPLTLMHENP